jgi:subtilisin family serine protease
MYRQWIIDAPAGPSEEKTDMRNKRLLGGVALVTPVLLVALSATAQAQAHAQNAPSGQAALSPAQAQSLSRNVTDKVIIVFKDQVSGIPDNAANAARRTATVRSLQRAVLAQLTATHARDVKSFSLINAAAATVSPGEAKLLAANPAVARVVKDLPIPLAAGPSATTPAVTRTAGATTAPRAAKPLPGACAPDGKVQLNPEAVEKIHAATASGKDSAQSLGYTGAGVKVAWIADGVDPNNPDFIRANGQHVFSDYEDFSGTGTDAATDGDEAFLDSSSIAAQGREVYNVAGYGDGLTSACKIRVLGVAPGASLVGLNVFGSSDFAFDSVFLEAINYAVTVDHVNVVNESFGDNPFPDTATLDLSEMADNAAIAAGVTVTVSSGDAGPTNTIGSPATDPKVISAGATTTYRAYAQTGIGGITAPGVKGWIDNNISGLSSGGFDQSGGTVDVVAPGDLNWALCTPDPAKFAACTNFAGKPASVEFSGGTSEAAPLTAGTAALVIQAYARSHHGQDPTPAVVKQIIVSTAEDIHAPGDQQGAGLLDAYQAVLAAASYHGSTKAPAGHAVLDSATQLNAVGQRGTTERLGETLTNDGSGRVTVGLSSRTLSPYRAVATRSLSLTEGSGFATEVTFTVPKGQGRLNASVALNGVVDLSLIAPDGDLAEFNLPQGVGNYGNAQVADPAPGKWTALISTDGTSAAVPAKFQASVASWQKFGSLSASSVTLAPGASRHFTLTVDTPAQAGDQAGSIVLHSSAGGPAFAASTSIPVTLRSLVPAPDPSTTFTGTLTGGNGRDSSTGQTAYYQVQIPSGDKALNVSVGTGDPANTLTAVLVNPAGAAVSTAANGLLQTTAGGGTTIKPEDGVQLHTLQPSAGRWTLVVDFYNTVSGTAVAQPFTVTINDTPAAASAAGLPDSAGTALAAGTPVTVPVRVTNHGSVPEAYFVDARLSKQVKASLTAQNTSSLTLPDLTGTVPTYLVPSHTTTLVAAATSTAKVFFDFTFALGDPDLISSTGTTATGAYSAAQVSAGDWTITPFLLGPTGAKAAKPRTATTSMTAITAAFDPAVTSPTGDLWLSSLNPASGFTPYVVNPGQTITIPVTITPAGAAGTVVSGTLYVSDSSFVPGAVSFNELTGPLPEGSDLAAFPYRYTIKK